MCGGWGKRGGKEVPCPPEGEELSDGREREKVWRKTNGMLYDMIYLRV